MTAGQLRYAEQVAIRLAVEVITGLPHPDYDRKINPDLSPYTRAARHLGAHGAWRGEVLRDLVSILTLYGYRPTLTVRRAMTIPPQRVRDIWVALAA